MSGLEVAGVVLGAFPILISALEGYREGSKIWSNWWKYERSFKNFKYEIECEQRRFEQNIQLYLLPLITDDDGLLQTLLQHPGGPTWQDKELEIRLRERIPENYILYLQTIDAMNDAMGQLREKLKRRRTVFAFSEIPRKALLDTVGKYNTRLQELLDTSDRIENLKQTQAANNSQKTLSQFWNHANSLYLALDHSWQCQSYHTHEAKLLLQHRIKAERDFGVIFLFGEQTDKNTNVTTWNWQEGELELLSAAGGESINKISRNFPVNSQKYSAPNQTAGNMKPNLVSLSHSAKRLKLSTGFGETVPPHNRINNHIQTRQIGHITSLCTALANCQRGLEPRLLKGHETLFSFLPKSSPSTPEVVTLDFLLSRSSSVSLTRRDRYFIALSLASSHLQLHSTPWLGTQWTKGEINIRLARDASGQICKVQPYISKRFTQNPENQAGIAVATADYRFSTLGIILLELCFGKPFEDYELRKQIQSTDPNLEPVLDHTAAVQWCNAVAGETGVEYQDAVKWCLDNTFARTEQWRKYHFARVVKPIWDCYNQLVDYRQLAQY